MGRSVSVPSGATVVAYQRHDCENFDEFDQFRQAYRDWVLEAFPSTWASSRSFGREDTAVAENRLAAFGLSEYCGLVALWIVPDDDTALGPAWVEKIAPKFQHQWASFAGWVACPTAKRCLSAKDEKNPLTFSGHFIHSLI